MRNTKLVGILNITPDSFSDGGLYNEASAAAQRLELMLCANPYMIDIGAISTRPKAILPSVQEEIERFDAILPAIKPILKNSSVKLSVDSINFETISYLLDKIPVAWVNDQSGFIDPRMVDLVRNTELKLVIMHHLTIPVDSNIVVSEDLDVAIEVQNWLLEKANSLIAQGIRKEQLILDPGIGFGKTAQQSWQLIKAAKSFSELGYQIMYGHSRKSFLNLVTSQDFAMRDLETAILSGYLANAEIDYLRVHDVESSARALKLSAMLQ